MSWHVQIVGWGLFTLIDLVNLHLTYASLPVALLLVALVTPSSVLLSTAMRRIYRLVHGPGRWRWWLTPGMIALCSVAAAAAIVALLIGVHVVTGLDLPEGEVGENATAALIHYFLAFAVFSLAYFWLQAQTAQQRETRRALAAEADRLRAELGRLRLQLDPHFLVNALNGVVEEVPQHPTTALAMLRDLTAFLRHSLAGVDFTVVSVESEVESFSAYLRVQRARFGARLQTKVDIDPAALGRPIASFLLQPLVENAIKYGYREKGLLVGVAIEQNQEVLRIEIENTGEIAPATRRLRPAIGLDNVRRRLALHYPGRHSFTLRQQSTMPDTRPEDNRVIATLILEGEPCSAD